MTTSVIQSNQTYKWLSTAESVAQELSIHFGKAWVKRQENEYIVIVAPTNSQVFHTNPGKGHLSYYEDGAHAQDFDVPAILQPISNTTPQRKVNPDDD